MGNKPSYDELFKENELLKQQLKEKKQLEEELAKTRILMQAAFDQSPVPLIVVTYPDFTFKIVNKATEDYLLVDAINYLNKSPLEIDWNWQEYYPDGTKIVNIEDLPMPQALKGVVTRNKEMYIVRHNGSIVWELASASPIYDDKNNLIGAILAITDITEHKQTELILNQTNDELLKAKQTLEEREKALKFKNEEYETINEELNEKNLELTIAKEKAEESDRLKTAFLQNMSHEIRTPMNAIMGFTSLLAKNYYDKEKLEIFSKIIEQRSDDLLNIINDLLDISKIESGQSAVNIENFNLNDLFSELSLFFRDYQNRINKQHITLSMIKVIDENIVMIKTDKVKLKQILINLITNAFKYTKSGTIECSCIPDNNKLLFKVADTGIGIPTDKYDFIFERFTQIKSEISYNISGTGLGLAIVKRLVELLSGSVWLESECNKGSTFYFTIDYHKGSLSEEKTSSPVNHSTDLIKNKTILIVEDDDYNALYLQEILKNAVSNVLTVNKGLDSVELIKNQFVDVVLMDVRLPDITGYKATKMILKNNPDIKIIAQTAYASNNERQKALDAGCIDYISKPTKQNILINLLEKYL